MSFSPPKCFKCEALISNDEIGIYKKTVNRGATEYLCLSCLSQKFRCSEKLLLEKIEYFRKSGCTLFTQDK